MLARIAMACASLALAATASGCGKTARAQPDYVPAPVRDSEPYVAAAALTGDWRWSHASQQQGVRRVEVEDWQLAARDGAVTGTYRRTVTFLSLDGMPFTCNQALSYQQRASFTVEGTYRERDVELAETGVQVAPSPCDTGHRDLARYQGTLDKDRMTLRWPGGEQSLVRNRAPARADNATDSTQATIAGSWRWQSRNQQGREIRVELEEWELAETDGAITGTLQRTVRVFDADGRRLECSGDTFYQYRDQYAVRGTREDHKVTIQEISVQPQNHPCLTRQDRHLDAAIGKISGDYVILHWRGSRRQVLSPVER